MAILLLFCLLFEECAMKKLTLKKSMLKKWGCLSAGFALLALNAAASWTPAAQVYPMHSSYGNVYSHPRRVYSDAGSAYKRPQLALNAYATAGVSSPQAILDRLKTDNNVPANIAPAIKVSNSNVLNAATDGQNLIITNTLLDRLTTDDERAFVISHELSHILLQHVAKTQARHVGLSLLDALLMQHTAQGGLVQLASELGIGLVDKRSSRNYELQADDLGVKLMTRAGYNPQAAIAVFDILKANAPANRTPEFLQDHPITDSRIHALVAKYKLSPQ
jgi:Zn-dependent protease with chaperone function